MPMESDAASQVLDPSSPSSSENFVENEPSNLTNAHSPPAAETSSDSTPTTSGAYPMRRRRNPAVLIHWIEEHPYNPYPTKGEKQGLAFYAGMTQRQLNDWFANARRNIKKVGFENWKKKHNGFSAVMSGIPLGNNCGLSLFSAATSTSNANTGGSNGLNSAFTNSAFTNTAFTIAPLNRPSLSTSAPCSVMSYPASNAPMPLASMTCVKPTPLPNSTGFVKVEGGGTYYGGGYSLAHAAADGSTLSPCSSASSVCLPFSESYQLTTGHTQAATAGPLLVDTSLRPFSTPSTATIPYICDQWTSTGSGTTHPTVVYNLTHPPVPMGSTTVLNHASFGLMSAHTPPSATSQCVPPATTTEMRDPLQGAQEESTSSPHESGYYSSTTSPTPNHHR